MGLAWAGNCNQSCRYHYRGRCIHDEPCVYVQAEAIAALAWAEWRSDYSRETERLALLADEERQGGIDWTLVTLLFLAGSWAAVVATAARLWR